MIMMKESITAITKKQIRLPEYQSEADQQIRISATKHGSVVRFFPDALLF